MSLASGTRLGPYEVVAAIGAGGMGEVYKAIDTRLDRSVAVKVLSASWAHNAEMKQRFDREAQTIAALNHPNICVLHDIGRHATVDGPGIDYLVMEHLEGETLAERLERGGLGLNEGLKVAIAIADALDKAHRRGVIHRDLKPSNVMLTASGPKLLDFGLAKWKANPQSGVAAATGHGQTDLSSPGLIVGTLQYMAPEQLDGGEADARTDIFAFGALLHEMITGKRAFDGKSRVLLISAIATAHPEPLSTLEPTASPALEHVLKTCLAKNPADRWQTASDLLAELRWAAEGGEATTVVEPAVRGWVAYVTSRAAVAAVVVLAVAGVTWSWLARGGAAAAEELRYRVPIQLTTDTTILNINGVAAGALFNPTSFAVSPDGRSLVFQARTNGSDRWSMYVRRLGAVAPQRLAGADDATMPFWSPDGRWIAYVVAGRLIKIEASGGPPQQIAPADGFTGGTWNADGTIVFGGPQGLMRVPAEGGTPEALTKLDKDEAGHFWPHFLPDGRRFLYTAWRGQARERGVYVASLDSAEKVKVLAADSNAAYVEPGYLVFRRGNAIYAQPFDAGDLALSGEPVRIADAVTFESDNGQGHFSVSPTGALAYFFNDGTNNATGPQSDLSEWQLAWTNRQGQVVETIGPAAVYRGFELSPDGTRVAVHRHDATGGDVWVIEPRGSDARLTFDASRHNSAPVWSPDGNRIAFSALRGGKWGLYVTLSSGSGTEELLRESELPTVPMSWARDGKRLVFWVRDPKTGGDLWVLSLDDKKAEPFAATPFNETHAQLSPDGNWIAYTSDSKDNRDEIYVRPFPAGPGLYQISNNGGDWPRWRRDGKELYFKSVGQVGSPGTPGGVVFIGTVFAATIESRGSQLEPGSPTDVINFPTLNHPHSGGEFHTYAVSADGSRFLYPQYAQAAAATDTGFGPDLPSGLTVAIGWAQALARR